MMRLLRGLENKDIPYMLEWMKDTEINQFYRFDAAKVNVQSLEKFIIQANTSKDSLHYAIVDKNDEYIGTASLKDIDYVNKHAEFAVALRKQAIGANIAVPAAEAIFKIAFEQLGLNRVYSNVLGGNERCIKYCKKIGYSYEGEFKKHLCINGRFHDLKWFAILAEEYKG